MTSVQSNQPETRPGWFARGGWYYLVVFFSFGILTPIPFAHAATRLRTVSAWLWAAAHTAAIVVLLALAGPDESDLVGGLIIGLMVVAMVHLTWVRSRVWPAGPVPGTPAADPAVAAALAARSRRAEARRLIERDLALARDLRIGRPDLPRDYDDGGLVDLNAAPAEVIAQACGVDLVHARRIVEARTAAGVAFVRVDDAFAYTDIPVDLWDRIRDRSVVLPH